MQERLDAGWLEWQGQASSAGNMESWLQSRNHTCSGPRGGDSCLGSLLQSKGKNQQQNNTIGQFNTVHPTKRGSGFLAVQEKETAPSPLLGQSECARGVCHAHVITFAGPAVGGKQGKSTL